MIHTVTAPEAPRIPPQTLRAAWIALAGLSAVFLVEMLDNSILNVALPTIARELHASATALQWITGAYAVVFGGLMLAFGAIADRWGRRRVMLTGLVLLVVASLGTAFVTSPGELIAVRALMGVAAAMTTPGSIALTFRLFGEDGIRLRAINLISTVGLVGLAVGPVVGGLVLAVAPWQVLLLVNVPVAVIAFCGVRFGITADAQEDRHPVPIDVLGSVLGTTTIVLALVAPTLFVNDGARSGAAWAAAAGAILGGTLFALRQRLARHPLLDLALIARPLVASGLAYKAASGLAMAGLSYLVTLQLQFAWGWPPALAAVGMLPQVIVLVALGPFVNRLVEWIGFDRAAWLSASAVVVGLAIFGVLGPLGYPFVALALVVEAAGLRVVGVVAGMNVLRGLPARRSSIGAALVDTSSEVMTAVGIAIAGTVLAALFTGDLSSAHWTSAQAAGFRLAVAVGSLVLTAVAAALVAWAITRAHRPSDPRTVPADATPRGVRVRRMRSLG